MIARPFDFSMGSRSSRLQKAGSDRLARVHRNNRDSAVRMAEVMMTSLDTDHLEPCPSKRSDEFLSTDPQELAHRLTATF